MKKAVVLLAILALALTAALWMNRQRAGNQVQRAEAEIGSLSNRLAEAEMKVNHQERMNLTLGSNLTNRADELARSAAELDQARTSLARAQGETRVVQAERQRALAEIQAVQSQVSGLSNRIQELTAEIRDREGQVSAAKERSTEAEAARQELAHQLGALQQENDRMARQLRDPELLSAQIATLKKQQTAAAESKRSAGGPPDYRLDLELSSDGNVQFVLPALPDPPPPSNPLPAAKP